MNGAQHRQRLTIEWWALLLLAGFCVVLLVLDRTTARFDNFAYDRLIQLDPQPPSPEILLVAVDQVSLARTGRWPWPRQVHAELIKRLTQAQPRAIAYDILFTEAASAAEDAALADAVAQARNVYLPMSFSVPGTNGAAFDALPPVPPMAGAAAGIGHVNLSFDPDGMVRSSALSFGTFPHLMLLVRDAIAPHARPLKTPDEVVLIPFSGRTGDWPTVSATHVLQGAVPPELLRNRVILVGVTADGLSDRYAVPQHGILPGVEIQAQMLNALLTGRTISRASIPVILGLTLIPLVCLMLVLRRCSSRLALLALVALTAIVIGISAGALLIARIWIPPVTAVIGLLALYPLWNWRQLTATEAFMHGELRRFQAEPEKFATAPTFDAAATNLQPSTVELLGSAIDRARQIRRFVSDRLDQLPDATFIADIDGRLILHNDAAEALLKDFGLWNEGRQNIRTVLDHFQSTDDRELKLPVPDQTGQSTPNNETYEATTADERFFNIRFASQTSMDGKPAGWVIRVLDISETKAATRQREDILQLLTHDMRSPQASILAILETARSDQIQPSIAAKIRHYAQRTLGLADGFVQLARAETLAYHLEEVSLADMLLDAIDDLWPQITAKNISVDMSGATSGLFIEAERSLLTRALINVISNAVKFSAPGSRITCTLGRTEGPDGQPLASCAIADSGPGLAPEHQISIFERFYRAPMGVAREMDGVGLGLSFVRTVTVRHNGSIECTSTPGDGTTFTFTFPLIG